MFNIHPIVSAFIGTGFTFLMTALGASTVFFLKKDGNDESRKFLLGFASGVMIAAGIWSLIIPSIERSENLGIIPWIPAAVGFSLGGIFFVLIDKYLPIVFSKNKLCGSSKLLLAVTLHNVPEGMAVGLAFAMAFENESTVNLASAIALAVGIGIQNFPEGTAISLPIMREGYTKKRAFISGAMSGIVEPIGGILTVFIVGSAIWIMPWLLSFAAGCMIFVVADELIPQAYSDKESNMGAIGVMVGFLVMMVLDVALG